MTGPWSWQPRSSDTDNPFNQRPTAPPPRKDRQPRPWQHRTGGQSNAREPCANSDKSQSLPTADIAASEKVSATAAVAISNVGASIKDDITNSAHRFQPKFQDFGQIKKHTHAQTHKQTTHTTTHTHTYTKHPETHTQQTQPHTKKPNQTQTHTQTLTKTHIHTQTQLCACVCVRES